MFSAKQFRILVHLDSFFKDHRREARIFIGKSMKTIADLENHITKMFNINDFYLSCQNYFLPSAEDVRIIQEDEAVWVWPQPTLSRDSDVCADVKVILNKRKKFKTNGANLTSNREDEAAWICPKQTSNRNSSVCADVKVIENKNKKLKTNGADLTSNKEEIQINNGPDKPEMLINSIDENESSSEEPDEEIQNKRETFQAQNTQTTKELELIKTNGTDLTSNKQVTQRNSVSDKPEILMNSDSEDESSDEESNDEKHNQREIFQAQNTQTNKEVEMAKHSNTNEFNNTTSRDNSTGRSSLRSYKVMSSIGALMDSLRSSGIQSDDSFVNKNRRRRIRKRKRSSKPVTFANGNSSVDTAHETTPIDTQKFGNNSSVHLRFSDVDTGSAVNSVEMEEVPFEAEQAPLYNYSALRDEDFSKYPVMLNLLPRTGDVISFKVLKISENYSPELSKCIVAKVIDYNATNFMVSLKILYGMSELVDPQGKFYIDMEDKGTVDIKELQWSQLITPRLLFP